MVSLHLGACLYPFSSGKLFRLDLRREYFMVALLPDSQTVGMKRLMRFHDFENRCVFVWS